MTFRMHLFQRTLLAFIGGILLLSCGSSENTGQAPSKPVLPPAPLPPPVPVPAATPKAFVCPFGKGTGSGKDCPKQQPDPMLFQAIVTSVEKLENEHPEYFIFTPDGLVKVKDQQQYFKAVIDELNSRGLCAYNDGWELAIKKNNDFSEQYAPWVTSGYVRLGENMYRATCTPAWF